MVDDPPAGVPGQETSHILKVGIGESPKRDLEFAALPVLEVKGAGARPQVRGCERSPIGLVPDPRFPRLQWQGGEEQDEEESAAHGRLYRGPFMINQGPRSRK